jgi:CBS domain-containing protein
MIKVKEVLQKKGKQFWFVRPEQTIYEALQLMADKDIGAVLVMENQKLAGVFSERDYARKIVLHGLSSQNTKVGDFMTKGIIYVTPDTDIDDCMALMTQKRIRHLPVMENNQVTGIISIGDVVNAYINQQKITINDLENYIYGGRM